MATVDLELNADLKKATKQLSSFSKDAKSSLGGLKTSFKVLGAVAAGALAGIGLKKVTDAAAQQEQAVRSLNTALALTGDFSEETSKDFQKFASELQKNSTVGDEVSLSMVALTKSMGATNEQSKKIIKTAVNLSAVTGESLETSVRNLTKTLGGMKGELGETQPELRGLTKEQLQAGEAIDLLSKKFDGTAKELTNTFSGAVTQTENSFGDLLEEIGFLITKNPIVVEAIKVMGKGFNRLGAFIKENRESIINFGLALVDSVVRSIGFVFEAVGQIIKGFQDWEVVIDATLVALAELSVSGIEVAESIVIGFKKVVNLGLKPLLKGVENVAGALNSLGIVSDDSLAGLKSSLSDLALDETSGFEGLKKGAESFRDAAKDGLQESIDEARNTSNVFLSASDGLDSFSKSLDSMIATGIESNDTLKALSDSNKKVGDTAKEAAKEIKKFEDTKTGLGIRGGLEFVAAAGKGAEGANQLVSSGLGALGNTLLPGSGGAVSAIAGTLMQGPEQVKKLVDGFVEQIPVIIDALIESLPVLINALVDKADEIIIALVKAVPKVAQALTLDLLKSLGEALPPALGEILNYFLGDAANLIGDLFTGLWESLKGMVSGLGDLFKDLLEGIWKSFTGLLEGIWESFKNFLGGLGEAFKVLYVDLPKKILKGLVNALSKLFESLKEPFSKVFLELPKKLLDALVNMAGGIGTFIKDVLTGAINAITEFVIEPIKNIIEPIRDLVNKIGDFLKPGENAAIGGSGKGGFEKKVGFDIPGLKFNKGGEIPPGFPNDSFFMPRAESGELVIDRSTTNQLKEFLNGGKEVKIELKIGERQMSEVILNLNRQGFRIA